ncbi:MAG TPA: glycosyltransferase [Candidatus Bathyarchaeia archaeon]|nr:glycosyltransferase [Candidatus Bathyarchaeia archaeon]
MSSVISSGVTDRPARVEAMNSLEPKSAVVIFAEPLLAPSMTFIGAQASALTKFTAVYVSPQPASPSLPFPSDRAVLLCDSPQAPQVWNRLKQIPLKVFGYAPFFFRRVARHRPVLVHAHFGPAGLTALPLARWLEVPLVVTIHGYDATVTDDDLGRSNYRGRLYVRKRHVLHKETALYIAVSEFLRKQMIARGFPEERIVMHYIGVDTQFFEPDQHTAREPVVLFTGRLTEKKGCAHLIRAMHEVEAIAPETRLVVIGDGELREELEDLASKNLRNYSFLGMQSPDVVRKWMNRATVFSVPSVRARSGDREGLGMVFLEAQAMGLPVAGFRSGGVPEAVQDGETGLLVEEGDWRTLAGNILTLMRERSRWRAMSEAGRRRVRASFDLATQTAKLEGMYGRVLKEAGLGRLVKSHVPTATSTRTRSKFPWPKQPPTAPRKRFAFVQPICTHYTVGLFTRLAERLDAQYFFFSDGKEWYWQAEHGVSSGDFPHEYLSGFRLGKTRIAAALPWKLLRCPVRAILCSIDGKFALPAAYLAARAKRVPFLLWTGLWFRLGTPLHRRIFAFTRFLYRHADAIVVYGEHVKRYLVSEGVRPKRIFVAPHAVDNAFYSRFVSDSEREALRRKLGIHAGQNVILYLGRLEAVKGIPHLLEAFAAARLADAVLVIAGAGRERPALERLVASLCIEERVRFVGYVPIEDTVGYYAIASVVVLPSVTTPQAKELWGLVVNEAFNQGVPVIATDAVGAVAGGLVRDGVNGVVVPEGNAGALARALERVVNDPAAQRQMGAAARRVVAEWSQDAQAAGFARALEFALRAKEES